LAEKVSRWKRGVERLAHCREGLVVGGISPEKQTKQKAAKEEKRRRNDVNVNNDGVKAAERRKPALTRKV